MPNPRFTNTPLVLIIMDGWGENPHPEHRAFNAVALADTPNVDRLRREYPATLVRTSGEDVGVPMGSPGNSEVGHQNIGAGRIVDQESVRITKAIRSGEFLDNPAIAGGIQRAKDLGRAVHLMGIASDAGVHGLLDHLYGCLDACREHGQTRVLVHLFTDGRDTSPYSGLEFVRRVQAKCDELGVGRIASVIGRYWAMDRDNRWERTEKAYDCLTGRRVEEALASGDLRLAPSAEEAVRWFYDHPIDASRGGDEFVTPTMIGRDLNDAMRGRVGRDDTVIFYNYRGDRPRQIVRAFVQPDFHGNVKPSPDTGARGFERQWLGVRMVTMTAYDETFDPWVDVAFPKPPKMEDTAGEYLSKIGATQFRCAETEKYAHVTFFFNDYREEPFEGERRRIVQSPKVTTYDLKPEMSAAGVADAVVERIEAEDAEDFIVVNFANADMVGHTGKLDAAIKAVETVDRCVGRIVDAVLRRGGSLIVTADHGNADQMWDPEADTPHTSHTPYPVPLIVVGEAFKGRRLRDGGRLADVAPTALAMMGVEQPKAMTGRSLLKPEQTSRDAE